MVYVFTKELTTNNYRVKSNCTYAMYVHVSFFRLILITNIARILKEHLNNNGSAFKRNRTKQPFIKYQLKLT